MDKLKEHLFKQHGKGTPPERRFKIAELQQNQNLTLSATGRLDKDNGAVVHDLCARKKKRYTNKKIG